MLNRALCWLCRTRWLQPNRRPLPSLHSSPFPTLPSRSFTTGDTPLESEPTLAPRLPGVIAATRWVGRLAGLPDRHSLQQKRPRLPWQRPAAVGEALPCLACGYTVTAAPNAVLAHSCQAPPAPPHPPPRAAPARCCCPTASTMCVWAPRHTSTTQWACMLCAATTRHVAAPAQRRARSRCTSTHR